jgi:hypothetical protein
VDLPSIQAVEQGSTVAANAATVAALGIGGWWTYSRFFKNRTGKPRAAISHSVEDRRITDGDLLVRVVLKLENTGAVLLPVEHLRCEIAQVDPPADGALKRLERRELISEENLADLGCIRCYEEKRAKGEVRIEPGEADFFPFDFVVSADLATISIYAHVPNSSERKKEIGWDLLAFYDLTSGNRSAPAANLSD